MRQTAESGIGEHYFSPPPWISKGSLEMIRTRHLAALAAVVALAYASQASAQSLLQLDYNSAKIFGTVEIAGGAIDITNGAMIVTTSSFGFVPEGYSTAARMFPIRVNSARRTPNTVTTPFAMRSLKATTRATAPGGPGFWNGTNGIISSAAAERPQGNLSIGWVDNSITQYTSFERYRCKPVSQAYRRCMPAIPTWMVTIALHRLCWHQLRAVVRAGDESGR